MNQEKTKLTIGQAFAARWLVRNYAKYEEHPRTRNTLPAFPAPEDLSREIGDAVDAYAERKTAELHSKLCTVAVEVVDGIVGSKHQVEFGADDMLEDQGLLRVANKWLRIGLNRLFKFPV